MEDKFAIQLFEGNKVRVVWNEEQEKYFFSVEKQRKRNLFIPY